MKRIFVLRKSTFKLVQLTNQTYTAGNKIVHSWFRTDHCWRNDLFQETRKAIGRHNSWNVELLLARSGDAHVLPANRTMVETSNRVWLFVVFCIFLCTLETVPSAISARRPPTERETAFAHTLSLFFSPWSTSANLLSPDHQPLATANCLQPCYSAYCLLSATPSSATLATPLLSTACGTIKLQLSYKE